MKNKFIWGIGIIIIFCVCYALFSRDTRTLEDMRREFFPNATNNAQTLQPVVIEKKEIPPNPSVELANSISIGIVNGLNNLKRKPNNSSNYTFDETLTIAIAKGIKQGLDGCYIKNNEYINQLAIHCPDRVINPF